MAGFTPPYLMQEADCYRLAQHSLLQLVGVQAKTWTAFLMKRSNLLSQVFQQKIREFPFKRSQASSYV